MADTHIYSALAAGEHTNGLVLKCMATYFRQIAVWFCVATVNAEFLAE